MSELPKANQPSLSGHLLRGAVLVTVGRWIMRGIGLLSTLILVRLLMPEDFGLMAMCVVFIGAVEVLFEFGVETVVIREPELNDEILNSAWTLRFFQSAMVSALVALSAPWVADYYKDARVQDILYCIAVGTLIRGSSSFGLVLLRKELKFKREVVYNIVVKLSAFFANVAFAWYLRNYWALALATLTWNFISCVGSYLVHPYRPKFCTKEMKRVWSFSQWMLVQNIINYASGQVDQLIIGAKLGAQNSGLYSVSNEIAELPTTELIFPIARVLFPGFSKLVEEPERLRHAFLNSLGFLLSLTIPVGIGLVLIAPRLVPIMLGEKWLAAIPVIQILSVCSIVRTVYGLPGTLLVVIGEIKLVTMLTLAQLLLFIVAMFSLISEGVTGVATAKTIASLLFLLMLFEALTQTYQIKRRDMYGLILRPILSTLVMIFAVTATDMYLPENAILALVLQIIVGAVSYATALLLLWILSGRPKGAESFFLSHLQRIDILGLKR